MKKNQDYKNAALASLKGVWPRAIVSMLVLFAISMPALLPSIIMEGAEKPSAVLLLLIYAYELLILVPIGAGYTNSFRLLYEDNDTKLIGNPISITLKHYVHIFLGVLLMSVIVAIGMILLIIPGIILGYAYSMVPYLLVERPEMSVTETLKASRMMMKGRKFDFFYLQLSFIGWVILSVITLGIGLLWLIPYMYTAQAAFYHDVKLENGMIEEVSSEPAQEAAPAEDQEPKTETVPAESEEPKTEPAPDESVE